MVRDGDLMGKEIDRSDIYTSDSIVNNAVRKALRHFSGCIAHDFNNLLTVQLAYPELIKHQIPEGSKASELLDIMGDNAELMSAIASRLAHFALSADYAKTPISIDDLVREVLYEFESDDLSFGLTIRQELNSGSNVMIPHDVFCRILREICVNSFESMNGSGTLTVETSIMNVDEPMSVNGSVVPLGKYVRISVCDSGCGINEDMGKNIFEPFFTKSKQAKARGSGLGLSIAFANIRDCGGYLLIENKSEGTDVSIILPIDGDEKNCTSDLESKKENETVNQHRVLVVDDEEEITRLFKIMLTSTIDNVHVDVAKNGHEAIDAFMKHNHAVVVMDLHMPIMDGQEAFDKLKDLCASNGINMPGVVFCTGYIPTDGIKQAVSGDTAHSLLQKPVTAKSLIDAVKERLHA